MFNLTKSQTAWICWIGAGICITVSVGLNGNLSAAFSVLAGWFVISAIALITTS